jgi:cytosine/adenosine deaminase-related metal-dependent hydrolase
MQFPVKHSRQILQARWIYPVASEPIAHGAIEIAADGRIAAVHRRAPRGAEDLGDVAIVPGFVNAHTHLEFSDLPTPLSPARPFSAWMRTLIGYRRQRGDGAIAIRHGLEESRQCGTVAFGEIATQDGPAEMPADVRGGVLFRELIGLPPEMVNGQLEIAERFLPTDGGGRTGSAVRGISPHAPYSVHPRLFERLVALAAERRAPLTIHLAETEAELQLLREGQGELVDLLSGLGVWRDGIVPLGTRPFDFLRPLAALERVIVAHGNYLDDEELDFVAARRNMAVAYCPRTHAYFGHSDHPWQKLLARGGLVAIGTDGRCSNPDLCVWNELLFLHARFPQCDPAILLQMGTRNGARALGMEAELGTLEAGKTARAAVVRLGQIGSDDPYTELFHPESRVARLLSD